MRVVEGDGVIMLDLCAGLGGASRAMKQRGWRVVTLDYDPAFHCDITADVRTWKYDGPRPDLIWASPPCDEFARESMPWSKTGNKPSMELVLACKRIIDEARPRFWVIENVRGAIGYFRPYFGDWRYHAGPFYLWGHFPLPGHINTRNWRKKESLSSTAKAERAIIPASLSEAVAVAIERQPQLLEAAQ